MKSTIAIFLSGLIIGAWLGYAPFHLDRELKTRECAITNNIEMNEEGWSCVQDPHTTWWRCDKE